MSAALPVFPALSERYRLESELGQGGMAVVYLAEDLKHHRRVAIKVIRQDLATTVNHARFLREIRIAAALDHPNIVSLYDSGETGGLLYYVMPHVEAETLRARLDREGQLPIAVALGIATEIASALAHAHARGVMHRDVKPENVFVGDRVLVSDFGLARAMLDAESDRMTESGVALGTPAYMSPEQAAGDAHLDARTDVYSLGCVTFEMLAGEPPFSSNSFRGLLAKHMSEPAPRVRVLRESVPMAVEHALLKALAKAPADRFSTMIEFRDALTVGAGSSVEGTSHPVRRRRVALAVALTVAVLLIAWWGVTRLTRADPSSIRSLIVLPLSDFSLDSAQLYLVDGMHDALIAELAQIRALRVISRTSSLEYRNNRKPLPEIGREMNVDAVLEGGVIRSADSVRLELRLFRARPEEHLVWSQVFQGDLRQIQTLYGTVARAIAERVEITLTVQERSLLATRVAVNPRAYEEYLRARFLTLQGNLNDVAQAAIHLDASLRLDSAFAPAYATMARMYDGEVTLGVISAQDALPKAKAAAMRAIKLDPTLPDAEAALATVKQRLEWDWAGADSSYQRAIALAPSDGLLRSRYANLLSQLNRSEEATAQLQIAERLDPRDAFLPVAQGMSFLFAMRYDEAIARFQEAVRVTPNHVGANNGLWQSYYAKGDLGRAFDAAKRRFVGDPETVDALDRGFRAGGYRAAMSTAAKSLVQRHRRTHLRPFVIAVLYAHAMDSAQSLNWLEQAYLSREPDMGALKVAPSFIELRRTRRFQQLVSQMNFPP